MPVRRPWQAALAAAGVLALLAGRGAQAQEVAPAPCAGKELETTDLPGAEGTDCAGMKAANQCGEAWMKEGGYCACTCGGGGAAPAPAVGASCAGKELETTDLPGAEGTDCAGMKAANQCGEAWMKDGGYCTCTCGGSAGAEDGGGGSAGAAPAPVGAACKGTELETTTLPGNDNKLDCAGMKGAGLCGADWMVRRNSPPAAEPLRPSATDPTPRIFAGGGRVLPLHVRRGGRLGAAAGARGRARTAQSLALLRLLASAAGFAVLLGPHVGGGLGHLHRDAPLPADARHPTLSLREGGGGPQRDIRHHGPDLQGAARCAPPLVSVACATGRVRADGTDLAPQVSEAPRQVHALGAERVHHRLRSVPRRRGDRRPHG